MTKKVLSRDIRVKKEYDRLIRLYKDIAPETLKVVDGLVVQASRSRIMLNDMWKDIDENGDTEMFTQSANTPPYERERPVARLYNSRDTNYQRVMKQLSELLPKEPLKEDDGFDSFLNSR